ncbi:acetate/propionate family kinase [Sphingomonas qilianensis]|uniref:Acetate kinase n=1 Tax=Sphingomonas qilianensis TaxID=1736690 RepID=A0ABU9XM71_9SPHN
MLTFNSGSSSLKFGLFDVRGEVVTPHLTGEIESRGAALVQLHATDANGRLCADHALDRVARGQWIGEIVALLDRSGLSPPDAIGHRLVHGGPDLLQPVRIDAQVQKQLEEAQSFAPLHLPEALAILGAAQAHFPDCPQIACFDTGFHASMPALASTLPLPAPLRAHGLRRYGFHGLSCESILDQLGAAVPERLVIAHLGNGASVTAVHAGRSVDTSMGLTPSGGVLMARRSGDLDPGVLIHLLRHHGFNADTLERLVNRESGLFSLSGIDGDLRVLAAAAADDPAAQFAIDAFCRSVGKAIMAMAQALGGVDCIVFTGGIGEHDIAVRATVAQSLRWIGVRLDDVRNNCGAAVISAETSAVTLQVLPSREDQRIAMLSAAALR